MAIEIIQPTSNLLSDIPGYSTLQCGHALALVETSFPHSLHFVIAISLALIFTPNIYYKANLPYYLILHYEANQALK